MPRQQLPDIDSRLCTLCGDCVTVCPTECLYVAQELEVALVSRSLKPQASGLIPSIVLAPQTCINCGVCEAICPADAITMRIRDW